MNAERAKLKDYIFTLSNQLDSARSEREEVRHSIRATAEGGDDPMTLRNPSETSGMKTWPCKVGSQNYGVIDKIR